MMSKQATCQRSSELSWKSVKIEWLYCVHVASVKSLLTPLTLTNTRHATVSFDEFCINLGKDVQAHTQTPAHMLTLPNIETYVKLHCENGLQGH